MFVRRTQTRNTVSGEHYYTHRLVQSKRVDDKVRQITLLNLGRHFEVDQEDWPLLCTRISDRLLRHKPALEAALFDRVSDLFGLSTTITLYDLTNTYFEGEMTANPKARRGHSKEKRSDCPLITLGLVLDGSGFVRRSEVFEGNVREAQTLEAMFEGLQAPEGALVVMDRGIATEANLIWLRQQGYRYLVVSRERQRCFNPERSVPIQHASGETLQLEKVLSEDGKEVRLYCHSKRRAKKEEAIHERFVQRFEAALDKIAAGLSQPRTTKRIDKLWERIGRLKEKSHGVGQYYDIELIPDAKGEKAVELRYTRKPVSGSPMSHPGVYCLRSTETDWDEEALWRSYITLTDLEAVFRTVKSELGLQQLDLEKKGFYAS